jgi:hypothetical protein
VVEDVRSPIGREVDGAVVGSLLVVYRLGRRPRRSG